MLNFTFFSWARLNNLMSVRSASSSLLDEMIMSSAITCTSSMSPTVWYTLFWRWAKSKGHLLEEISSKRCVEGSERGILFRQRNLPEAITVNTFLPLRRQSVRLLTFCMTLCFSIRSSLSFNLSCSPNGTLRGGSFTGTVSCRLQRGMVLRSSLVHYTHLCIYCWYFLLWLPFTPLVINPRCSHIESPKIGGDYELTM